MFIQGVLESLERDEGKTLIEKYGGRVTTAISGRTNYLVTGRDISETKIKKAREMKIKMISEDELLELIRTRPGEEEPSTSKAKTEKLKRKSSASSNTTVTTTKKTTVDPEPPVIPKTTVDDSSLLCKPYLHMPMK